MYDFKKIEEKWQEKWNNNEHFKAIDFHPTKPKYYVLYEFYNISGNLHLGHLKGTVPADALARMKRMQGYNVLFPIGGDAFGLPAENAAIKYGTEPKDFVANGMENVIDQSKKLGLSFDYDRTIATSDEDYYKWTQWIFLQLLKNDKAYKEKGIVNFCPNCKTVLSNEDSQDGICDRCHGKVIQEERDVWYLKMKEYADKLLGNVDRIEMNENLKESQRNWIGKTEGYEITFPIYDKEGNIVSEEKVFTKNAYNLIGLSCLALAPEHQLVKKMQEKIININDVKEYQKQTSYRSNFDRISNQKNKTACCLEGLYTINPYTNEKLPLYITDMVLPTAGVELANPVIDERYLDIAQKYNIDLIEELPKEFKDLSKKEMDAYLIKKLKEKGILTEKTNYKMQDWPFNRQRYWGEPFPVVFCPECGTVPLEEKDLPLTLPETKDYTPKEDGSSPLSKVEDWVNCKCPKCGHDAKRETDTMPNWAGSSWYWLRYCDPHNKEKLADFDKLKYWGSADCYTGGTEHITRHVLYAFFWQNFLYEIGAVPSRDPFKRKMGSGLILDSEGKKMSKSSTNGVSPLEVIEKYGCDAARLHIHFLGGYEDNTTWTYEGIKGITGFLNKVWDLQDIVKDGDVTSKHSKDLEKLTKKVTSDIESLKLNTSIAACMGFVNKVRKDNYITKEELRRFLILLNPLAPHITSEIYENVFNKDILDEKWPKLDEKTNDKKTTSIVICVDNRKQFVLDCPMNLSKEQLIEYICLNDEVNNVIGNLSLDNVYYVPNKMLNIVTKNKVKKK